MKKPIESLATDRVSGLSPFAGECDVETMGNVTVGKYDFNDEAFDTVSADCMDFITKLLKKNPTERLTAHDALKHRWVKKKPQYHPTNSKPAGSPLSFKAVYQVSAVCSVCVHHRAQCGDCVCGTRWLFSLLTTLPLGIIIAHRSEKLKSIVAKSSKLLQSKFFLFLDYTQSSGSVLECSEK